MIKTVSVLSFCKKFMTEQFDEEHYKICWQRWLVGEDFTYNTPVNIDWQEQKMSQMMLYIFRHNITHIRTKKVQNNNHNVLKPNNYTIV